MKIRAILPIRNFSPEVDGSIPDIFGFKILKGSEVLKIPSKELDLLERGIGTINLNQLQGHYFLQYIGTVSDNIFLESNDDDKDICSKLLHNAAQFIRLLWFIKDNSCFVKEIYLLYTENLYVTFRTKSNIATNSEGRIKDYAYSAAEISQVINMFHELKKYNFRTIQNQNYRPFEINSKIPNPLNEISYINSRITRAFIFLNQARDNSRLISKISFYIAMFESLFTNNTGQIGKVLRKRIPLFLRVSENESLDIQKLISDAYNVRSRFFHGDDYSKNISLEELSKKIDNLSRKIFNKILILPNKEVFTVIYPENGNKELENYFNILENNKA